MLWLLLRLGVQTESKEAVKAISLKRPMQSEAASQQVFPVKCGKSTELLQTSDASC